MESVLTLPIPVWLLTWDPPLFPHSGINFTILELILFEIITPCQEKNFDKPFAKGLY